MKVLGPFLVTVYFSIKLQIHLPDQAASYHLSSKNPSWSNSPLNSSKVHILAVKHTNFLLGSPEALNSHWLCFTEVLLCSSRQLQTTSSFLAQRGPCCSLLPAGPEEQKKQPPPLHKIPLALIKCFIIECEIILSGIQSR